MTMDELWWIPKDEYMRAFAVRDVVALRKNAATSYDSGSSDKFSGNKQSMSPANSHSSPSFMGRPVGLVFSKGLGFAGQVFGLYSTSRSCLVGIEERKQLKLMPFMSQFVHRLLSKALGLSNDSKGPMFHFYVDKDDAKAYVKRLNVPDMDVGHVPLHLAYNFFSEKPSMITFVPAKNQVEKAKELIRKERGRKAAKQFSGVPVFTSDKLSILVVSPNGVKWFRPHFFKKEELDNIIKSSMEHHYQSIIRNRRALRHNQISSDLPPDMSEDETDMLESQEMQEFMEDMDEWNSVVESMVAKAAQIHVQDALDVFIFGNKWCRKLAGIQPNFPILVDSFERRALSGQERASYLIQAPLKNDSEAPHLTVVAGGAGSSEAELMKAASSAIEEAKDNEMAFADLFIADLGNVSVSRVAFPCV